jgi:hypothetical protein
MNTITSIVVYVLAGFVILILLIAAGLLIKPRVRVPDRTNSTPPGNLPDQPELEKSFKRYIKTRHGDEFPNPFSVLAWGTGRMVSSRLPIFGPIWIPINWTLDMLPGKAFVLEGRFFWFRRMLFIGTDQYINGKGQFVMSDSLLTNSNLTASELTLLWVYTILLSPTCLINTPGVSIAGLDLNECTISIDSEDGKRRHFTLKLNPASGSLYHLITQRTASKSGEDLDFHVRLTGSIEFEAGKEFPRELHFAWEDVPYLKLDIAGVAFNRNIQDILDEADQSEDETAPSGDGAA